MDGFSPTSLTTACSTISQRAIASAGEIRTLERSVGEEDSRLRGPVALAGLLDEASRNVLELEQALNSATAIAERLRLKLDEALKATEPAIASLNKQIMTVQASNVDQLSTTYVDKQKALISAYSQLFGFYTRLLTAGDETQQNKGLDTKDMCRLDDLATQAANEAQQPPSTILTNTATFTSLSSMMDDLPPAYSEAGPSSSAQSQPGRASEGEASGWLKSSFNAFMSSVLPKPDPFLGALCEAVAQGNARHVGALISQGANVNGRNEHKETPLQVAIRADNVDMANMLVSAGASTTNNSGSGLPAMFEAAAQGKIALAKVFLDHGADVHHKNTSGQAYFYNVVERGNAHGVKFLLEQGANVHTKSISGRPVLAEAVRKENCEMAQLLLANEAKITCRDINGASLLSLAVASQNVELVKLLLEHEASPNSKNVSGSYVIAEAIASRNLPIAGLLFDHGADGSKKTISGQPLIITVVKEKSLLKADREYLASRLLQCGAKPDAKDMSMGIPVLHLAIQAGQFDVAKLLIEHGAKTNGTMSSGETPLMYTVSNGTAEDVKVLLKAGADPAEKGKTEMLPLMQAVIKQDKAMIRVLREYGASVGESAIAFAAAIQQPEVLEALGVSAPSTPAPVEETRPEPRSLHEAPPPAYDAFMKG